MSTFCTPDVVVIVTASGGFVFIVGVSVLPVYTRSLNSITPSYMGGPLAANALLFAAIAVYPGSVGALTPPLWGEPHAVSEPSDFKAANASYVEATAVYPVPATVSAYKPHE